MKEILEKYKTDNKYKAKTQLIVYGIFILFVSIFSFVSNKPNDILTEEKKDTYNYQININLNDNIYKYYGTKSQNETTINKVVNEEIVEYKYKNNKYYKHQNNVYSIINEEEIFDIIQTNYLSIETINKYLELSTITDDKNLIYLKDIIIGSNSEDYITILKEENKYNIDYTSLMKLFDNNIDKLTVEIIIE